MTPLTRRLVLPLLVLLLSAGSLAAGDERGDKPDTPAEQYQAILKDYQKASTGGDGTDEGRRKLIARLDQLRPALAQRFLDLAEQHPSDPVAVDALTQAIWMVNHNAFPAGGKDSPGSKAVALLLRDHLRSDKLGPTCLRINTGFRQEHETFLRTLLERSPHKNVQELACLALAQFLNNRMQRLDQIKQQPELAREYEALFGKEFLAQLQRPEPARAQRADGPRAAGRGDALGTLPHLEVGLGAVPHVPGERRAADPPEVGEPVGVEAVVGHAVLGVVEGPVPGPLAPQRHTAVGAAERVADAPVGVGRRLVVGRVGPARAAGARPGT